MLKRFTWKENGIEFEEKFEPGIIDRRNREIPLFHLHKKGMEETQLDFSNGTSVYAIYDENGIIQDSGASKNGVYLGDPEFSGQIIVTRPLWCEPCQASKEIIDEYVKLMMDLGFTDKYDPERNCYSGFTLNQMGTGTRFLHTYLPTILRCRDLGQTFLISGIGFECLYPICREALEKYLFKLNNFNIILLDR